MLFDIIESLAIATIVVAILAVAVYFVVTTKLGKMVATFIVFMIVTFAVALASGHAEGQHVTVVIVYYEEDIFIVEDDNGYRDIYDDRGDLVPGDELIIDGDNIELYAQSNWLWFDYTYYDDILASFLYPEDARRVSEYFQELP